MRKRLPTFALLFAITGLGCVTPGPRVPAPANVADSINLKPTKDDEAAVAELLVKLIQADTSNPPGNEGLAVAVLDEFLKANGVETKIVTAPDLPDRPILVARVPAPRRYHKPLVMLGHTDVVPADASAWDNGKLPFSGRREDGYIYGRGALDMKGMLAAEAMTMVLLQRNFVDSKSHKLERDVYLVATPDEEDRGLGAQYVAGHMDELFGARPEFVINEGGIGLEEMINPKQNLWAVSVGERGNVWLDVTVRGATGHASQAWTGFANQKLIDGLSALRAQPFPVVLGAATRELLRRAAPGAGFLKGFMMARAWLVQGSLTANAATNATVRHTCLETGLKSGGRRPNVIPPTASAVLDCRVLPGVDPQEVVDGVKQRMGLEDLELVVRSQRPGTESSWESPLFGAFERHLASGSGQIVAPVISPGSTDSAWFRAAGVPFAYGLVPFMIPKDELRSIHGINERLAETELRAGVARLTAIVADVAGAIRPKVEETP